MCGRKEPVNHLTSWLLYVCYIFVLLTTTSVFVSSTFLVQGMILQMLFLVFSITTSEKLHQTPTHIQTSSLLGLTKPSLPPPAVQILWCHPVILANIPIRFECLSIVLLSFQHYSYIRFFSNSPVLLCGQKPISIL